MKTIVITLLAAGLMFAAVSFAGADTVLFKDNFQPQIFAQYDINRGYNEECYQGIWRQSGSLGFMTWNERAETAGADPNTQPQTGGTIIWHNWGDQELEFLCSGQWGDERKYIWASPNHNFMETSQMDISFKMDPNAYPNVTDLPNWGGVVIGTSVQGTYAKPMSGSFTTATSTGVGFTLALDGLWNVYEDNALVQSGTFAGAHDGWYNVKVGIDGSRLSFFVDGSQIYSYDRGAALTSNYITLAGYSEISNSYQNVFFDDFTVTAVPEPGSMLALMSGLVGLAGCCVRRRRS